MSDAGSNLPTLTAVLSPEVIDAILEKELTPLKARASVLTASCMRFLEAHAEIETEAQDGIAAELLAVLQRFMATSGRVEVARIALKAPLLVAERRVDRAFKEIGTDLAIRPLKERRQPFSLAETVLHRSVAFKAARDRLAQEQAAAEAKRLAEQAAAAERLADAGAATFADAAIAQHQADKAEAAIHTGTAARTRTRGSDVGVTSLQKRRIFEVIQPALVPREYCEPSDSLIRHAIGKAGDPMPTIAGVSIRDEDDLTVRK